MGKTFVEDERPCDSCVNVTRYGCASWNCEYINRDEAIKAWREKHETADRKTENSSEIPNNFDKDTNVRSKDEPQINASQHVQHVESVETMSCQECRRWIYDDRWGWFCPLKGQDECKYEPKTEPQTSKIIEAYAKGYKDGADAVKDIKDKQIRACDICKYEIGETCTHPKVKTMKKEWATFEGDLWGEENTPKWCPIDKDEPQTDGILFKGNLKEGDYKLIKTSNGWVLEGNDIAYCGEPKTERKDK